MREVVESYVSILVRITHIHTYPPFVYASRVPSVTTQLSIMQRCNLFSLAIGDDLLCNVAIFFNWSLVKTIHVYVCAGVCACARVRAY